MVSIQNFEFELISSLEDLNHLQNKNYSLGSDQDTKWIQTQVIKGGLLFCVFVKKKWAHQSWVILNGEEFYDPFFRRSGYSDAGCIGPCKTSSNFRGLGFYPYVLNEICLHLNKIGLAKALISTSTDNHASVNGIKKAQFQQRSRGLRVKLGPKNFWIQNKPK